jgi:hypothetical protein
MLMQDMVSRHMMAEQLQESVMGHPPQQNMQNHNSSPSIMELEEGQEGMMYQMQKEVRRL